jgi:hypothetical protein
MEERPSDGSSLNFGLEIQESFDFEIFDFEIPPAPQSRSAPSA